MDKRKKIPADIQAFMRELIQESLHDWFKKKWVRIDSAGNIAGPCGTSKNTKNPDRCLPRAKAQSLTKAERAATAAKKKKAGAKGKTVVKNTKKATVKKETKSAPTGHYFTKSGNLVKGRMSKDAKERGARKSDPKDKQRSKVPPVTQYTETANPQDGKSAPYGSGFKKVTKEDIRNLVVGLIHEMKNLNYNNFVQMTRDDMMAGAAPDEYPSDERVRKYAKALYSRYLKGASLDDLFETKDTIEDKDDRCTRIAKSKYDTWPSALASGAVVRCRRGEIWKNKK